MPRTVRLVDLEVDVHERGGVRTTVRVFGAVGEALDEEGLALATVDDELQEFAVRLAFIRRVSESIADEEVEGAGGHVDATIAFDHALGGIAIDALDEQVASDGGQEDGLWFGVRRDFAVDFDLLKGEIFDGEGEAVQER